MVAPARLHRHAFYGYYDIPLMYEIEYDTNKRGRVYVCTILEVVPNQEEDSCFMSGPAFEMSMARIN